MRYFIFICVVFLLSCRNQAIDHQGNSNVAIPHSPLSEKSDTVITFELEGISAEGSEAKVHYTSGKISTATINIYGETGRADISYIFAGDSITVLEKHYSYDHTIEDVKSDSDAHITSVLHYTMDREGKLRGKVPDERLNIYSDFRKVAPFELQ